MVGRMAESTDRKVILQSDTLAANISAILIETFRSPAEDSYFYVVGQRGLVAGKEKSDTAQLTKESAKKVVGSHFKLVFLSIFALILVLLLSEIILSAEWPQTTSSQATTLSTIDTLLKSCVGAILGLLGGKLLK